MFFEVDNIYGFCQVLSLQITSFNSARFLPELDKEQ